MNWGRAGLVLVLTGFAQLGRAQPPPPPPLELTEHDDDGHAIALTPPRTAIDLNSHLEIALPYANLLATLQQQRITTTNPTLTNQLRRITRLVEQERAILDELSKGIATYERALQTPNAAARRAELEKWRSSMDLLAPVTKELSREPGVRELYEQETPTWETLYPQLFRVGRQVLAQQRTVLDTLLQHDGVYIQLGAWLVREGGSVPLHLPGFDDYPEQPRQVVERWQYVLTDEQKAQLQQIEAQVKLAEEKGIGEMVKAQAAAVLALNQVDEQLAESAQAVLAELTSSREILATLTPVRDSLQRFEARLQAVRTDLAGLATTYQAEQTAGSTTAVLVQTNDDLKRVTHALTLLVSNVERLRSQLTTAAPHATQVVRNAITQLKPKLDALAKALETTSLSAAHTFVRSLTEAQQLASSALEFTDHVRRVSVNAQLPSTTLDLATAGPRDQGDEIVVKVAAGSRTVARRELQVRRLRLLHLIPFVRLTPGLLFVDPLMHEAEDQAMFRAGASYSILYKGFWGKAANRRAHPNAFRKGGAGLGVNIATLDFNSNGAPEVGFGFVGSFLADIFQGGGGFNSVYGTPYYFFSVRLPVLN